MGKFAHSNGGQSAEANDKSISGSRASDSGRPQDRNVNNHHQLAYEGSPSSSISTQIEPKRNTSGSTWKSPLPKPKGVGHPCQQLGAQKRLHNHQQAPSSSSSILPGGAALPCNIQQDSEYLRRLSKSENVIHTCTGRCGWRDKNSRSAVLKPLVWIPCGLSLFLLIAIISLIYSKHFSSIENAFRSSNFRTEADGVGGATGGLDLQQRCFSMCEPLDILPVAEERLVKSTLVHDGRQPMVYFLQMYPPEPSFDPEEVGEALFLTPYLREGKVLEAQELAKVRHPHLKDLVSYAGFFTVNQDYESNMYFWFFPSQSDPANDPVIIWLQGGPGATSLYGLFKENGPMSAKAVDGRNHTQPWAKLRAGDGKEYPFPQYQRVKAHIEPNRYSWNRNASMLYIDNPVGAGFSFTGDQRGYPRLVNESSVDLYEFIQQFFHLLPQFSTQALYIFGESYGGKYVPALTHLIYQKKKDQGTSSSVPNPPAPDLRTQDVEVNLVGLGLGNGWMSPVDQGKYASYLYYHGLLDGEQYLTLLHLEDTLMERIVAGDWYNSWLASDQQLHYILQCLNYSCLYDITRGQYSPSAMDFWHYLQQPEVRKAAKLGSRPMSDGLTIYKEMVEDTMMSIVPELTEAMENYKVLIYHGALDIICHFPGAQEMLVRANWTGKEAFHHSERRSMWFYNEETTLTELAGYVKGDGNVKLALIRNAGHSAPKDQPQWAMRMVEAFVKGDL